MSESQTYEFLAIDRPLTTTETKRLREISSRADITAARFFVRYDYGELKADPAKLLAQSFDAFLHVGGWGGRWLALRLPKARVDAKALGAYFPRGGATLKVLAEHVIVDVPFEPEEPDGGWDDEEPPALASLLPLRDELLRGDLRFAYLAWLWSVDQGSVDDAALEPPVPPGLAERTSAQEAFLAAFELDPALVEIAADASPRLGGDDAALSQWVAAASAKQKDAWLARALAQPDLPLGAELRRAYYAEVAPREAAPRRTAGMLRDLASVRRAEHEALARGREARARAAHEAAAARRLVRISDHRERMDRSIVNAQTGAS